MKFTSALTLASLALLDQTLCAPTPSTAKVKRDGVYGMDISAYQDADYDFASAYADGARFVLIKATEGTYFTSDAFSSQYDGATQNNFIRGGYHFAIPDDSDGASQADFFVQNGGGWSGDGITLPGMLDIEYNPYGDTCYGLSTSDMVSWISDFVNEYESQTGRYPIIYSTNDWWSTCTGDATDFSSTCPLDLASYNDDVGTIPGGWPYQTFWQYDDSYAYGGDSDVFNGGEDDLTRLATG